MEQGLQFLYKFTLPFFLLFFLFLFFLSFTFFHYSVYNKSIMSGPMKWPAYQSDYPAYPAESGSSSLRPLQPNPYLTTEPSIYPHSSQTSMDESRNDIRRTRISRACDACRRKKIKCDTNGPGDTCKKCKAARLQCTFNDSAKKRGPPKG
ncbi:hypothetical protein BDB01DRAFT_235337 [Pilobolus umbonatus]|nr:hypothetical protein BDB01DRAFT_235337 [Pilobolus umbonatus]